MTIEDLLKMISDALELRAYEATVANLEARIVPDGWQLVPVEPTQNMLAAGKKSAYWDSGFDATDAETIYEAMLAAAPQPKKEKQCAS